VWACGVPYGVLVYVFLPLFSITSYHVLTHISLVWWVPYSYHVVLVTLNHLFFCSFGFHIPKWCATITRKVRRVDAYHLDVYLCAIVGDAPREQTSRLRRQSWFFAHRNEEGMDVKSGQKRRLPEKRLKRDFSKIMVS
jgi:hypothetical protein